MSTSQHSQAEQVASSLIRAIKAIEADATIKGEDVKKCQKRIGEISKMVFTPAGIDKDEKALKVMRVLVDQSVLKSILYHMEIYSPQVRQHIKHIWLIALRSEKLRTLMDDLVRNSPEILILLVRGYTKQQMVQICGDILRFCIKHEPMLYLILFSPLVWQFFNFAKAEEYEKSSDAFKTFKVMLTRNNTEHKAHVAKFLKEHFKQFFIRFRELLTNDEYHIKRQALRLLSEVLQARENFHVMVKFISQPENLELMVMHLCQSETAKKKGIKSEAFHVFKFFVANPRKPQCIVDILSKHKKLLLTTLEDMDRDGNEYGRELPLLIQRLKEL